jgi:hypothetical protein
VIAVNDYSLVNRPGIDRAYYSAYSAYAERRTFIEGWQYSQRWIEAVADGGSGRHVYDSRLALNKAAFAGDPAALRELYERFGVRFLVLDKPFNDLRGSPRLYGLTAREYASPSMDVLEIRPALLERSATQRAAI